MKKLLGVAALVLAVLGFDAYQGARLVRAAHSAAGQYNANNNNVGPGTPILVSGCLSDVTVQAASFTSVPLCAFPASGITANSPINVSLSVYSKVTQAATTSSTLGPFTMTYTDCGDSTSQAPTIASSAGNTTSTIVSGTIVACVKPGTTPTFSMAYASSGATPMQYEMHFRIEDLN